MSTSIHLGLVITSTNTTNNTISRPRSWKNVSRTTVHNTTPRNEFGVEAARKMGGERNWDFPWRPSSTSSKRTQILPDTVYRLIVNNRPFILRSSYLKFVTLFQFLKTGFANRSDGSYLKYIKIALVFTPISMKFLSLFFLLYWLNFDCTVEYRSFEELLIS